MSEFLKPQSPLRKGEAYIYPLTTEDQIIMEDGSRLSGTNFLSFDDGVTIEGTANPINADTLGGKPASEYVLQSEIGEVGGSGVGKAGEAEGAEIFNCYEDTEHEEVYEDEVYTWTAHANKALGEYSHAEGECTTAIGYASHAEGYGYTKTILISGDANATTYTTEFAPDILNAIITVGDVLAIVLSVDASPEAWMSGIMSFTVSDTLSTEAITNTQATISAGIASGYASHAEGYGTVTYNDASHAEGYGAIASGYASHAEGYSTVASGQFASHAEGEYTVASGRYSHAEGRHTVASGDMSHAEGDYTIASSVYQHVQGVYNIEDFHDDEYIYANQYLHIVGNGTTGAARSNAHTIDWTGNAVFAGTVSAPGADYAEHFEWLDGNPNNEDRVGTIVALDGDKIRPATADDEVLGVVSGTAMVIGDNAEWEWQGKFLTDNYGRVITEMVEEFIDIKDHETGEVVEKKSVGFIKRRKLNPEWKADQEYARRSDRPEWDVVGLFGKLHVNDDGTCVPNGWATVGEDGKATASVTKTNMRVMKRINDNIVLVFMK